MTVRKKSLRERFDERTEAAKHRLAARGLLYPDPLSSYSEELHEDRDEYWVQVVTRGPDGRFMVERLKLRWPLAMTNMKSDQARARLLNELAEAFFRLRDRKARASRNTHSSSR